jgi:hypothetical protein
MWTLWNRIIKQKKYSKSIFIVTLIFFPKSPFFFIKKKCKKNESKFTFLKSILKVDFDSFFFMKKNKKNIVNWRQYYNKNTLTVIIL